MNKLAGQNLIMGKGDNKSFGVLRKRNKKKNKAKSKPVKGKK